MGYRNVRSEIQLESMDDGLRTAIWNAIHQTFFQGFELHEYIYKDTNLGKTLLYIWENYFEKPNDEINQHVLIWTHILKKYINESMWFEVYDLLEQFIKFWPNKYELDNKFVPKINKKLEQYLSGYRVIVHEISPITDDIEISEIETILEDSSLQMVSIQISDSLQKLSDREFPDYRGSIKDSISAVETMCRMITKNENIELGKALKTIEEKTQIEIHPALKEAYIKLYGWTSNDQGIRHGLMDYPTLGFAEAKFMLVACSAFINLLKEEAKDLL